MGKTDIDVYDVLALIGVAKEEWELYNKNQRSAPSDYPPKMNVDSSGAPKLEDTDNR